MWLLVRARGGTTGVRELASCPDSPREEGSAEPWQWTMTLDPEAGLQVAADPDLVHTQLQVHRGSSLEVDRRAGTILGLVPLSGRWVAEVLGGPWRRVLGPGDLLLAEDDRAERLRLRPAGPDDDAEIHLATITPTDPGISLRWIP